MREKTLRHNQVQMALGSRHGNVEEAAFLRDLCGRARGQVDLDYSGSCTLRWRRRRRLRRARGRQHRRRSDLDRNKSRHGFAA
jgi:hypothetical protein